MKDFDRFSKRLMIKHAIHTVLAGVVYGFLTAAIVYILLNLTIPSIAIPLTIVLGLAGVGFGSYIYWNKKKPTIEDVAREMDKALDLHEKCSTLVEYWDCDSPLINKQRQDALNRIGDKSETAIPIVLSTWAIPALVISVTIFAASLFTPKHEIHIIEDVIAATKHSDEEESSASEPEESTSISEQVFPERDPNASDSEFDSLIDDLKKEIKEGDVDEINETLESIQEALNDVKTDDELAEKLNQTADAIDEQLDDETNLSETDQQTMRDLAEKLRDAAKKTKSQSTDEPTSSDPNNSSETQSQVGNSETDSEQSQSNSQTGTTSESSEVTTSESESENGETTDVKSDMNADIDNAQQKLTDSKGDQPDDPAPAPGGDPTNNNNGNGTDPGKGGNTDHKTTDTVFTGNGSVEYGEVINNYEGNMVEDARNSDDDESTIAVDDYMRELYDELRDGESGDDDGEK